MGTIEEDLTADIADEEGSPLIRLGSVKARTDAAPTIVLIYAFIRGIRAIRGQFFL